MSAKPNARTNSHVARIVHADGWPHAAFVRENWDRFKQRDAVMSLTDMPSPDGYLPFRLIATQCVHQCSSDGASFAWHVWHPVDYKFIDSDAGYCPNCQAHSISVFTDTRWDSLPDRKLLQLIYILHSDKKSNRDEPPRLVALSGNSERLSFAVTEAKYRNLVPTVGDLYACWDFALSRGKLHGGEQLDLVQLWTRYLLDLREAV